MCSNPQGLAKLASQHTCDPTDHVGERHVRVFVCVEGEALCVNIYFFFASMAVALDALRGSIGRHNDTFETLLALIPARFYISKEPDETEVSVPTFRDASKQHL